MYVCVNKCVFVSVCIVCVFDVFVFVCVNVGLCVTRILCDL